MMVEILPQNTPESVGIPVPFAGRRRRGIVIFSKSRIRVPNPDKRKRIEPGSLFVRGLANRKREYDEIRQKTAPHSPGPAKDRAS